MERGLKTSVMFRGFAVAGVLSLFSISGAAAAETWTNAPLVDTMCSTKVKSKPDEHTTACALQCAKGGFGILVDGNYLKFDEDGNAKVVAALKASKKVDHLRATVTGERQGEIIKVASVRID